jgi:hypothetical protein
MTRTARPTHRVASSRSPRAIAKHDEPPRRLVDADLVDCPGVIDVGVPTKDLLDALTALLEKLDRVSCDIGRRAPDSNGPRTGNPSISWINPK